MESHEISAYFSKKRIRMAERLEQKRLIVTKAPKVTPLKEKEKRIPRKLIDPKNLLDLPKSDNRSAATRVLINEAYRLQALRHLARLEVTKKVCKIDDDFFAPFVVSTALEDAVEKIKEFKGKKKEKLSELFRKELHQALLHVKSLAETELKARKREWKALPEIFKDKEFEVERAIVTQLDVITDEESKSEFSFSRFRKTNAVRIGKIIDRLSSVFREELIHAALQPHSKLFRENILLLDYSDLKDSIWTDIEVRLNPEFLKDCPEKVLSETPLFQIEKVCSPDVELKNVLLPEKEGGEIRGLLKLYKEGRIKNLSLLLHGDAGTGKTSLGHAVAKELGMQVAIISADGLKEDSLPYVISFLTAKFKNGNVALLFDECEKLWYDKFSFLLSSGGKNSERGALKQILENISGVIIYTSNIDPPEAFRRRVSFTLHMKKPNHLIRRNILKRELEKFENASKLSVNVSDSELERLSEKFDLSGGFYQQGILLAAAVKPNELIDYRALDKGIGSVASAMKRKGEVVKPEIKFSDLILSTRQKETVGRIIKFAKSTLGSSERDPLMPKGVTVLLEGPSGTGKTVLAEAIASDLGLKFRRVTPSSFLSMWVGETESKIREVLSEAHEEKYLLFLDEAEGMLHSRESATQSWEKTQIDEWLNCIEQFEGVFIAATNHKEMMDAAFSRRFLFKLQFALPGEFERRGFLEKLFGEMLGPTTLERLAENYPLSFGELRNAYVQLKTYDSVDGELAERVFTQQVRGRSGYQTRPLGLR